MMKGNYRVNQKVCVYIYISIWGIGREVMLHCHCAINVNCRYGFNIPVSLTEHVGMLNLTILNRFPGFRFIWSAYSVCERPLP